MVFPVVSKALPSHNHFLCLFASANEICGLVVATCDAWVREQNEKTRARTDNIGGESGSRVVMVEVGDLPGNLLKRIVSNFAGRGTQNSKVLDISPTVYQLSLEHTE